MPKLREHSRNYQDKSQFATVDINQTLTPTKINAKSILNINEYPFENKKSKSPLQRNNPPNLNAGNDYSPISHSRKLLYAATHVKSISSSKVIVKEKERSGGLPNLASHNINQYL